MKTKKRLLSILLSLVLVLGLMPGMSLTAYANEWEGNPYADLVNTTNVITFDNKAWYLIEDNSTAANAGTVTLLAKECVGASSFNSDIDVGNTYSISDVKTFVDNWYNNNISAAAKAAVSGSGMFLLTKDQANAITNAAVRKCSGYYYWWLCSPNSSDDKYAWYVSGSSGNVYDNGFVYSSYGVRPALKLDLSKVTFASVNLSGGANATASGGSTFQNYFDCGTTHSAMTTVTYTASEGNMFPATSDLYKETNGITVARTSDNVVTVSGTPTANANITIPDAIPGFKLLDDTTKPVITIKRGETEITEGAPQVGDVMTAETGATDLVYEWYRGNEAISGATNSTYTLTKDDVGKAISVKVYQTKDASGNELAGDARPDQTSAATTVVEKKTPAELSADDAKTKGITFTYADEAISANDGYEVSSTNEGDGTAITSLTDILDGEGTPTFYVRTAATDDTAAGAWVEVTLTARPAAPTGLTTESATNGSTADGKIKGTTAAMEYSDDNGATWNNADATETAVKPGTYLVRAKATESAPHGIAATVTVGNREIVLSDKQKPTAKTGLVYTGSEQELVNKPVEGLPEGAREIQYALGENATTAPTDGWSTSIPAKTDVGTYYVWYKVAGDENHNDTDSEVLSVRILPVNRDSLISTVSEARAYYNEIKDNDDYAQAAKDLLDAITDAEAVAENDNAKESDIRTALTAIIDAIADAQAKVKDIDAVNAVKNLIDALPSGDTMSTADKDAIEAARKAYEDLTDAQKAKVPADVLKKLTDAETAIETLLKDEADGVAAGKVEKMINALPAANAVKAGDKDAIEAARKAYEDLTDAQKAKISADVLKKLTDAEQALADTGKKPADLPSDAEAEKQTEISNQKRDEMVDLLNSKGTREVKGIYQTGYDTVSADYVVTNGKITQMSIDVKGLKEGKNYLTINTGVRLVLGDAFTISGNFVDEKDAKKIAKFVKTKKKEGCVFEPKRLKHYRGGSYEVVLTKGKVELIVDVIDVSLNKKSIKTITLTNAVSQSAVSANAVAADKIGPEGSSVSGNVVTLATSPVFKAEIPPMKDKSARFLSGIWQVGDTFISRGEVKTVTKGKVKVIARANSDGSLSIGKADGSGSGSIKISYVLNGKVKKTKNGSKIKSMVYKAKVKVK